MKKIVKRMDKIFEPGSVAIIGASKKSNSIGNVLMKNFVEGKFHGKIFPVNPKYDTVLGLQCFKDIEEIQGRVDCAIIATPAKTVPGIVRQCANAGVGGIVVLSGGFEEVGNKDLALKMKEIALENDIPLIGPNCLGIFNQYSRVDSIFLPTYKLERPKAGGIAFITQSGAVGSTVLDLSAFYGLGVSKFISYGNGTVLNENHFLEYLENDDETEIIILYLEGTKDGRELLKWMERVNKKKPIVALKAGKHAIGQEAAKTHTGNIAGDYLAYKSAFRQAGVTEANSIDELFDFVRIFNQPLPKGDNVGIVTNGGGMGILTTDSVEDEGLKMAKLSKETTKKIRKILPSYGTAANPLDLVADADVGGYESSIEVFMEDDDVDMLAVVVLFQTPPIDERILHILTKVSDDKRKPMLTISVGGQYTENYRKILESRGVPSYQSPSSAIKALKKLLDYSIMRNK
jgi:acetyl coenzyme A synthetase (ADP forming)-like protein